MADAVRDRSGYGVSETAKRAGRDDLGAVRDLKKRGDEKEAFRAREHREIARVDPERRIREEDE
jgi:hypothetical protein